MRAKRSWHSRAATLGLALILLLALAAAVNWLGGYRDSLDGLTRQPLLDRWSETIEQQMSSGEYRAACDLIDGLAAAYPGSAEAEASQALYPQALLKLAEQYRARAEYGKTLGVLDEVIRRFPDSEEAAGARGLYPAVILEKALREWGLGERDEAVSGFDTLLKSYPDSPEASRARELCPGLLLEIALLARDEGDYADALNSLIRLARDFPWSGEAAAVEGLRYDIYAIMRDEAISSDLAAVAAMFPSRVVDRLASIGYSIQDASRNPYGIDNAAGVWDGYSVILYAPNAFQIGIPQGIILHEWGHAIDDFYLDEEEKAEYRRLRGIPADIPWMNYDEYDFDRNAYESSPNEDFAAVFSTLMCEDFWYNPTAYGPIADPAGMELWMVQATSN